MIELSKIIEDILAQMFGTKMIKQDREMLTSLRNTRLDELNVRLSRWLAQLPDQLSWSRWNPGLSVLTPHVARLQ
jgi:hypothetical protein